MTQGRPDRYTVGKCVVIVERVWEGDRMLKGLVREYLRERAGEARR